MTAVTREIKTQAALIALARTRRVQRALAHAYMHRHAPMPTLGASLGYLTTTARVADGDDTEPGHRMTMLGLARLEGIAYILEEISAYDAPIIYRLYLRGPRQGHLVPLHAWYDLSSDPEGVRARIAALAPTLEQVRSTTAEAWMLSTRIVQRRALKVGVSDAARDFPIRKFSLQLVVEPVSGIGPSGRSTVTAFLRPHAQLAEVWSLASEREHGGPADIALARVTYTGIPNGTGHSKDTVVLLTSGPM